MNYLRPSLDTGGMNIREADIQAKQAKRIEQTGKRIGLGNVLLEESIQNLPEKRRRETEEYETKKKTDAWKLFQDQTKIVADMHAQATKEEYPELYDFIGKSGLPHIQAMPTPEEVMAPGFDFEAYRNRAVLDADDVVKKSQSKYESDLKKQEQKEKDAAAMARTKVRVGGAIKAAGIRTAGKGSGPKAADSNNIGRQVQVLFGGRYSPVTGEFSGLDKKSAEDAQAVRTKAELIFNNAKGTKTHAGAVTEAAMVLGINIPSQEEMLLKAFDAEVEEKYPDAVKEEDGNWYIIKDNKKYIIEQE